MTVQIHYAWEYRLLTWAQEAFESHTPGKWLETDNVTLANAYLECEQITREHSRTFYMASGLLAPERRHAARALYAFCRVTDDLVDRSSAPAHRLTALREWQQTICAAVPAEDNPVALAWANTQLQFRIPRGYAEQLIEGCATDLTKTRYATFDELAEYSYGVASTVGLMVMHIIGFQSVDAIPYAIRLGVALQMTNILRDVAEDWRAGRLYLPQDELALYSLSEADIEAGQVDNRWRAFMRFQIERNRRLYAEALPGIALLNPGGRFAIMAAANLYEGILTDIERHDYDVFSRRAHVSPRGKLARLPGIWWRTRRMR